jgi:hypothetical protein
MPVNPNPDLNPPTTINDLRGVKDNKERQLHEAFSKELKKLVAGPTPFCTPLLCSPIQVAASETYKATLSIGLPVA